MSPRAWLLAALFCGLAPLAVGLAIFLAWLATHWDILMPLGGLTIAAGCFLFPIGIFAIMRYVVRAKADAPNDRIGRNAVIAAGLLLLNFPAAGAIVVAAIEVRERCSVLVENFSGAPLEGVEIHLQDRALATFGTLTNGEYASLRFVLPKEGGLRFRARLQGKSIEGDIDGYVSPGDGGDWKVTVGPDGALRVRNRRRPIGG